MKNPLLCILFCLLLAGLQAQTERLAFTPAKITFIEALDPLKYPGKAIRKGIEGTVSIEIRVDSLGAYHSHRIVSSPHELLTEAVAPYIPQLKFRPALEGEVPISSTKELQIIFSIQRKLPPKTTIDVRY